MTEIQQSFLAEVPAVAVADLGRNATPGDLPASVRAKGVTSDLFDVLTGSELAATARWLLARSKGVPGGR